METTNSVTTQLEEYGFKEDWLKDWKKGDVIVQKTEISIDEKKIEFYRIVKYKYNEDGVRNFDITDYYTVTGVLNKLEKMKQEGEI